jgi:hypothetical protein
MPLNWITLGQANLTDKISSDLCIIRLYVEYFSFFYRTLSFTCDVIFPRWMQRRCPTFASASEVEICTNRGWKKPPSCGSSHSHLPYQKFGNFFVLRNIKKKEAFSLQFYINYESVFRLSFYCVSDLHRIYVNLVLLTFEMSSVNSNFKQFNYFLNSRTFKVWTSELLI